MRAAPAWSNLLAAAIAASCTAYACGTHEEAAAVASPCAAFPRASMPSLRASAVTPLTVRAPIVRVVESGGREYALDAEGGFGRIEDGAFVPASVNAVDVAVDTNDTGVVRAFLARWSGAGAATFELVRLTSPDGGLSFDRATEKVLLTVTGARDAPEQTSLAFGPDRLLYVALGDAFPGEAAPPSRLGKILRLDVSGDAYAIPAGNVGGELPEIFAVGVHEPRGLDVDAQTGDVWLTDRTKDDSAVVVRITRAAAEPVTPTLYLSAEKRPAGNAGVAYRGSTLRALVGTYVYPASGGKLVVVDRFGPSGTAQSSAYDLGSEGVLGRGRGGELAHVSAAGLGRVVDASPPGGAPRSLLATKCWDALAPAGVPAGAIPYDVIAPLWSDGAAKERFVVVPAGTSITSRSDGDLVFPVGTVAVKTFVVDGKRVETRLLVQHDVEDWTGYSYAWNADGTDAELVDGNRVATVGDGKRWYFPSAADCTACHTPAAGYTLGLEAKQLLGKGDALARLEDSLRTPLDRGGLTPLVALDAPAPATDEDRARSYLHSNCATCHREGSATGTAVELDLRFDTPLAATGLCREPQAGTLGIAGARLVAPGDPSRSVLAQRMRVLDERRMPRLGTSVVDEAGLAAVESWIRGLTSCP